MTDTLPITPIEPSGRARQNRKLLRQLRLNRVIGIGERKGISALEALEYLGIYRCGARVYDLRRAGYQIRTERHHNQTARYFLEDA